MKSLLGYPSCRDTEVIAQHLVDFIIGSIVKMMNIVVMNTKSMFDFEESSI